MTNPWLVCPRMNPGADFRLICFPYAGGSAPIFRAWSDHLPDSIEVCGVQLPGRGSRLRESPFVKMPSLIAALTDGITPDLRPPYGIFGHSLGAILAFEVTRALRRAHHTPPIHLFVSGCAAPQIPYRANPIHNLTDQEFLEEIGRWGGTPPEILAHTELMQVLLPALRADFTLRETYIFTYESPLDCPITTFGGQQDQRVAQSDLAAWQAQTQSDFSMEMMPGSHFFLTESQPHLLNTISAKLLAS